MAYMSEHVLKAAEETRKSLSAEVVVKGLCRLLSLPDLVLGCVGGLAVRELRREQQIKENPLFKNPPTNKSKTKLFR